MLQIRFLKIGCYCTQNAALQTALNGLRGWGWGLGAGARGLAKRIQFATGYVPALASGLLGRSANQRYVCDPRVCCTEQLLPSAL